MVAQGTYGASRTDLSSGVKMGQQLLKFLPLNKTALKQQEFSRENLMSWVDKGWRFKFEFKF